MTIAAASRRPFLPICLGLLVALAQPSCANVTEVNEGDLAIKTEAARRAAKLLGDEDGIAGADAADLDGALNGDSVEGDAAEDATAADAADASVDAQDAGGDTSTVPRIVNADCALPGNPKPPPCTPVSGDAADHGLRVNC